LADVPMAKRLDRYSKLQDQDKTAASAFLDQRKRDGYCSMTKPGTKVRVESAGSLDDWFGSSTCIAPLGSADPCQWTNREIVWPEQSQ
jgi:hypothetical protein